jgi:hypothetical protein
MPSEVEPDLVSRSPPYFIVRDARSPIRSGLFLAPERDERVVGISGTSEGLEIQVAPHNCTALGLVSALDEMSTILRHSGRSLIQKEASPLCGSHVSAE